MDDDELVARVAAGDDTALRELFGRHAPWLAVRLRTVLPAADVEDVLQETFLAAWRGARGYRPQGACGGWLWGIARRQAALLLRRRGPADQAVTALPADLAAGPDAPDPAETVLARADLEVAVAALGPAGSPEREVWRLMYEQDRPVAEVAELLGVPSGTVKSRAHRARRLLRAALRAAEGGAKMNGPPDDVDLSRVWISVAAQVWRRQPGRLERTAARLLRSPGLARALLTTPSLLLPWLIASAVVLAAGAATTLSSGQPLVALLAPAVAAAGIAYSYGPGVDPAWELSCSMAVSDRTVLLARALAVFAMNAALGLAASAVSAVTTSGAAAAVTFGWLIPMTAVCAFALAVATVARSANAGAAAGVAAWLIIVLSGRVASGHFAAAVTDTVLFLPYLAIGAVCAAIVLYATRIPRGTLR